MEISCSLCGLALQITKDVVVSSCCWFFTTVVAIDKIDHFKDFEVAVVVVVVVDAGILEASKLNFFQKFGIAYFKFLFDN